MVVDINTNDGGDPDNDDGGTTNCYMSSFMFTWKLVFRIMITKIIYKLWVYKDRLGQSFEELSKYPGISRSLT